MTNPRLKKTRCSKGHEYNKANTYITKRGYRACAAIPVGHKKVQGQARKHKESQ